MKRRHFITLLLASSAAVAIPSVYAQGNSGNHGHGKGHGDDDDNNGQGNGNGYGNGKGHGNGNQKKAEQRYFTEQDRVYVTRYYNGPRDLPPGLRKKYYRTGTLPPGWEKKFSPMPAVVIQQLPPVPPGYQAGYYEG